MTDTILGREKVRRAAPRDMPLERLLFAGFHSSHIPFHWVWSGGIKALIVVDLLTTKPVKVLGILCHFFALHKISSTDSVVKFQSIQDKQDRKTEWLGKEAKSKFM
jgi:hypothetical protein